MGVLFYRSEISEFGRRLQAAVEKRVSGAEMEIFSTPDVLLDRLRVPGRDRGVVVLVISMRRELEKILSFKGLLSDCRVVVALPAHDPPLINASHRLRPRFIGFFGDAPETIAAVIGRILQTSGPAVPSGTGPVKNAVSV